MQILAYAAPQQRSLLTRTILLAAFSIPTALFSTYWNFTLVRDYAIWTGGHCGTPLMMIETKTLSLCPLLLIFPITATILTWNRSPLAKLIRASTLLATLAWCLALLYINAHYYN